MLVIPRLAERLSCMLLRRRLELEMEEVSLAPASPEPDRTDVTSSQIKPDLTILRSAADELRHSSKFKQILSVSIRERRRDKIITHCLCSQTVLMIGNTLNAGNFMRGNAGGFSLDTLLKVCQDGKIYLGSIHT